jgi:hypothetical protein
VIVFNRRNWLEALGIVNSIIQSSLALQLLEGGGFAGSRTLLFFFIVM